MFKILFIRRRTFAALTVALTMLLASCGSDTTTEAAAEDTIAIEDREAEVAPAVERMFDFIGANPDVCAGEFESFNVVYPEDPDDPQVAELDAGIEDRGTALSTCLTDAGETELSEDISLLTLWGRYQADLGS